MSEIFPEYRAIRQPMYFFLQTPERLFRIRVPWLSVQAVVEIIESPQGHREYEITFAHIPGPEVTRRISSAVASHLIELAREERWIE